jgi:hypothetical protein
MLVLALSIEAAFVAENWLEFGLLCKERSSTLKALANANIEANPALLQKIEEVDARVAKLLSTRMRHISENLRKLAQFRHSLSSAV